MNNMYINEETEEIYTFSSVFEKVRVENYNLYNESYQENENINSKKAFLMILNNYLQNIIQEKININEIAIRAKKIATKMIEHLTGDYEIGTGDVDFTELTEHAETISSIIAYSDEEKLSELLTNGSDELAVGLVDGTVASGLIPSEHEEKASNRFRLSPEKVKIFFEDSLHNIIYFNEKVANLIAHITKMDTEESKEFNNNIGGKFIGGILYDAFSSTLAAKRYFTPVINSKSILEKIEKEGILHFTSPENASKIMKTGKIKQTNFIESNLTKNKSFFFAGTPTFEDLLINVPAYDVMTAIKINPTEEQIQKLKYRAINDRAVVKDGDFEFDAKQAEVVYYGLMYDKEKKSIYLGKLEEEEAKNFKVSQEIRDTYKYTGKKCNLLDEIKLNAYGLYAEYKHNQKLLQMEAILRENGIKNFKNVNDETLVELADIEQAYISTKNKSVERKDLLEQIRAGLMKNRENSKEERENDEIVH